MLYLDDSALEDQLMLWIDEEVAEVRAATGRHKADELLDLLGLVILLLAINPEMREALHDWSERQYARDKIQWLISIVQSLGVNLVTCAPTSRWRSHAASILREHQTRKGLRDEDQ